MSLWDLLNLSIHYVYPLIMLRVKDARGLTHKKETLIVSGFKLAQETGLLNTLLQGCNLLLFKMAMISFK